MNMSHGDRSTSISPPPSVKLHDTLPRLPQGSQVTRSRETTIWHQPLIRASYHLMRKISNRYLPTPVELQRKPGDDKSNCQTALKNPRAVSRSPWKKERNDVTPKYKAVGGSHSQGLVNYAIFESSGKCLTHVSRPPPMCGRNYLSIGDTAVVTDEENTISTFPGEPSKMVNFHQNCDSPCRPSAAVNAENKLHWKTTKSHGGQSTSMTTTIHQLRLHPMGAPLKF